MLWILGPQTWSVGQKRNVSGDPQICLCLKRFRDWKTLPEKRHAFHMCPFWGSGHQNWTFYYIFNSSILAKVAFLKVLENINAIIKNPHVIYKNWMYLKIFQLQSLVNLGFIGFLFPVRCTPQKGFSRNLWAGIQIWVNQGGRSNVSVLPYCMTVVKNICVKPKKMRQILKRFSVLVIPT